MLQLKSGVPPAFDDLSVDAEGTILNDLDMVYGFPPEKKTCVNTIMITNFDVCCLNLN